MGLTRMNTIDPNISIDDLPPITSSVDLGDDPAARIQAVLRRMERMTSRERAAAICRGELWPAALRAWAARRPHEL
jgi:hypothetical protein